MFYSNPLYSLFELENVGCFVPKIVFIRGNHRVYGRLASTGRLLISNHILEISFGDIFGHKSLGQRGAETKSDQIRSSLARRERFMVGVNLWVVIDMINREYKFHSAVRFLQP